MKIQWKKCDEKSMKIYNCLNGDGFVKSSQEDMNEGTLNAESSLTQTEFEDESSDFSLNYSDDDESKNYLNG
jgi:hypothetical protein